MRDSIFESVEFTIGKTGTRLYKVANFLRFIRIGMQNRYPICCVTHFAWDRVTDKPPCAKMRGSIVRSSDSSYVPCRLHMRRDPRWIPYAVDGKPREQLRLFPDEVGKT